MAQQLINAFPFPLDRLATSGDVPPTADTFEHVQTLLEHITGLAQVCRLAAESGLELAEDLPASLAVLHGYCETTLALVKRWQATWQGQRAAAEAQRQASIVRSLSQDAAEALDEIHNLLPQCPPKSLAAIAALVRSVVPPEEEA
jgi:hypothetical protein